MKRRRVRTISKVGLALGAGSARGLAHFGVLDVLQREGIPVDLIAGTSAGAIAGAVCAQQTDFAIVRGIAESLDLKSMFRLMDPVLPETGLIGGKKITSLLRSVIGKNVRFEDLPRPFACVATDVLTGEEVVIDHGPLLDGIRASMSVPGIFSAVKWKGRYLVDGMIVNPVPVRVVRDMGADFVIAVNVIPDADEMARQLVKEAEQKYRKPKPNIFSVLLQSLYIGSYSLVKTCLEDADIVIQPHLAQIGYAEFHKARQCIRLGESAAQEALPEIRHYLQAYQPVDRQVAELKNSPVCARPVIIE